MNLTLRPVARLAGAVDVPGDKSITHRALLLGALGEGPSRIRGYLDGGDCRATIGCLRALGIAVEEVAADEIVVHGRGLRGLCAPAGPLDCVRSGTTMRLLAGLLAGQRFPSTLGGDAQLLRRPMDRVAVPLRRMGADVRGVNGRDAPPLTVRPARLRGVAHDLAVASAQVKSCLLLAGLYAAGETAVREPAPSRDHTERMLRARGVRLRSEGLLHTVEGPAERLEALDTEVPGDLSSAAYWVAAGLLAPAGEVRIRHVGVNPTRTGLLDALAAMGADVARENPRDEGGEPVADLVVRPQPLRATTVSGDLVPRMIDEFPVLALVATQAAGVTRVRDAAELRVKETDRIATVCGALRALGAEIEERPDGFDVRGPTPLRGALAESHGDHRLAMTLAVAGLVASGETVVREAERIADSYPGFTEALATLTGGGR
jgi:3-phosphoshikimate 1-carboxyvinyltransferase